MFRKLGVITVMLALATVLFNTNGAKAASVDPMRPDIVCFGDIKYGGVSTNPICIDYDGDVLPSRNVQYDLGAPTIAFRTVYAGSIKTSSGIVNISERFVDVANSSSDSFKAGGYWISSGPLVNAASTYYASDITSQPFTVARNIVIYSSAPIGVTTTTLVGTCTFYGTDNKGRLTQEAIAFSTAIFSITTQTNVIGLGNVAWSSISSFTVQITSITQDWGLAVSSVGFFIGWGNRLGLSNDIAAGTDVFRWYEDTTLRTATEGPVNSTFEWVYPVALPNSSRDYLFGYKAKNSTP